MIGKKRTTENALNIVPFSFNLYLFNLKLNSSAMCPEPSRTSKMELFAKTVDKKFLQKASSQMFHWVLNTPLLF